MCALKSLMSQILSNTRKSVFRLQNVGGSAFPKFLFEEATDPPAPLLLVRLERQKPHSVERHIGTRTEWNLYITKSSL